ncbi:unnamed protein product [Ectocarpus sp. CCAP 1310/34]|nr:unnamed protein product [Ectocarpus sp. CCAP 1310/34]
MRTPGTTALLWSCLQGVNSFTIPPQALGKTDRSLSAPSSAAVVTRVEHEDRTCRTSSSRGSSSTRVRAKGGAGEEEEGEEQQDIIEKFFSLFFGNKDDAPGGDLDRITVKKFPDQYPAEKILQAEPVKGDSKDMAVIRPLLKQTELEFRKLKLVYDAKRNGWKPAAFHKGVDFKGPALVVGKTKGGAVVGGYNPKGWVGYGEYRPGLSAFLFTWRDGDTTKRAMKLRKIGGAGLAVWDKPECGPLFGSDGFGVGMQKGSERMGRSKLGSYYERLPAAYGGSSIFAPGDNGGIAEMVDLKAYVGVYERGEKIPFDDAIPFSLS